MKGKNQKKKIFVLNRIFEEHTDLDHGLRMNEILMRRSLIVCYPKSRLI